MSRDDREWWRAAIAGDKPAITAEPRAGFYKRRMVKGGPFVPVHIWIERELDEAGDLLSDEVVKCTVDGVLVDVSAHWTFAAGNPISEREFDYLSRVSAHAKARNPREPLASPRRKIDPLKFPLPVFSKGKKKR